MSWWVPRGTRARWRQHCALARWVRLGALTRWVPHGAVAIGCGLVAVAVAVAIAVRLPVVPFAAACALAGAAAGRLGRVILARLREPIVCRPPWCELATAMLSGVVGAADRPVLWLAVPLLVTWLAVPLAAADLLCRRLPDALTLPAYPLLTLAVALGDPASLPRAVAGAALFGGAHLAVRLVAPGSVGAGDVKLAGALGLVLGVFGWSDLVVAATLAAFGTLLLALGTRSRHAAHGPGLLAATWLLTALTPLPNLPYV